MANKDEFDELREKEEAEKNQEKSFMNFLAMMAMANKAAAEEEKKMESEFKHIGKVLYLTYSGMVKAGFTPDQAMELTKCLITGSAANPVLK